MVTSARVENGTVVLLNEHGGPGNRLGNQAAVAGVCGTDLIVVTKHGLVEHYKIEGGERAVYNRHLGKSYDPVSIQVNAGLNFSVQKENGQTDVYVNGQKSRTIGEAKVSQPTQSKTQKDDEIQENSSSSDSYGNSGDAPDGVMAGMMYRCKEVINTPINGPWAKICAWLMAITGVVVGVMLHAGAPTNLESWQHFVLVVGSAIAIGGLGYWLRHALAKCFVRSWYGAPAVLLASVIYSVDPTIGIWALAAAFLLWFWPMWPIMIIVIAVALLVLVALGKCAKTKD